MAWRAPRAPRKDVLSPGARPWRGPKVWMKNIPSHGGHSMPLSKRYATPWGKGRDGAACPRVPHINPEKAWAKTCPHVTWNDPRAKDMPS